MRHRRELQQLTIEGGHEVVASIDLSPTWGGARPGAGRPKNQEQTVTISIRVPIGLRDLLLDRAHGMRQSLSEYLVQMIRDCECPDTL